MDLLNFAPCFSQVLSDEVKRKQYDTYGSTGFDAGQAGGGQQYWTGQTSHVDPEELFRKIFGEFSGGRGFGDFNAIFDQPQEVSGILWCKTGVKSKPRIAFWFCFWDLTCFSFGHFYWCMFRVMHLQHPFFSPTQYIMELTFTQAAKGVNKEISVNIEAACERCDGKGHEPGTKVQHCHFCNGSGMVRALTQLFFKEYLRFIPNAHIVLHVGDSEHGPVCDALHVSSLWRQRHGHLHPLSLLPWGGADQAEEGCDGSCACRSVSLNCLLYCLRTVNT